MSEEALNTAFFPIERSVLSADALAARVLPNYHLDGAEHCQFLNRGLNDTYLVRVGDVQAILRVYVAGWRSQEQILAELHLLNLLYQNNIPVAVPIARKDETYLQALPAPEGTRYAVLFTYAEGKHAHELSERQSYLYGRTIAQVHALADQKAEPYTRFHFDLASLIDIPLERAAPFFAARPDDLAYLQKIAETLQAQAYTLPQTTPAYGICHGDVNGSNVHFCANDKFTLFDFDLFGYGWRVYDIGTFFWSQVFEWNAIKQRTAARRAFLEGYQLIRPLSDAELSALPYFVALRHMWFLGSAIRLSQQIGAGWFAGEYLDHYMSFIKAWMDKSW